MAASGTWMHAFARTYRRWSGIHKYGLQYEDLLVETPAVNEALRRLPHDMLVARDQRIKRAFDLSHKKVYLPPSQHSDPLRQTHVVRKLVKEVKKEFDERAAFRK